MNSAIAVILFLLTSVAGYVVWYIIRGRSKKLRRQREEDEKNKKKEPVPTSSGTEIPKDSYCYPKINDMMGYEFISVVKVPAELLKDTRNEDKQNDWGASESMGLKAVPSSQTEIEINEDEPWVDNAVRNLHDNNDEGSQTYDTVKGEVAQEKLDMLNKIENAEWGHRDYDDEISDDDIDTIINSNSDVIEQHDDLTEEDTRAAREADALRQMQLTEDRSIEMDSAGSLGAAILDELDEDEDYAEG